MTTIEFSDQLINLEHSLMRYAHGLKLCDADAKDLVQDTYLKAILNRHKFVDTRYLKAWAFTIMRNTFINSYRHNRLQNTLCDHTEEKSYINSAKSSAADNPDSVYSVMETNNCVEQLNDKFKVPFKMFLAGYKYNEIATTFNLKLGTVKSRIFLARKTLMCNLNR